MRGKVARMLRRVSGSPGRYRALKRLYNQGKVITGGAHELCTQPAQEVLPEARRAQAEARALLIRKRASFARYAPIRRNTAQRKLKVRPDSALARERRSWHPKDR